jgi:hypothetical protein
MLVCFDLSECHVPRGTEKGEDFLQFQCGTEKVKDF